jgi:hypothetical protein
VVSYAHLVRRTVQPERLYNTRIQNTNLVSCIAGSARS